MKQLEIANYLQITYGIILLKFLGTLALNIRWYYLETISCFHLCKSSPAPSQTKPDKGGKITVHDSLSSLSLLCYARSCWKFHIPTVNRCYLASLWNMFECGCGCRMGKTFYFLGEFLTLLQLELWTSSCKDLVVFLLSSVRIENRVSVRVQW